jgi:type IV pilus assembly protein PilB
MTTLSSINNLQGVDQIAGIDLPPASNWANLQEGQLAGAEVVLHLLEGNILHGRLKRLSTDAYSLAVQQDASSDHIDIPFSILRYLRFAHTLPTLDALATPDGGMRPAQTIQAFHIDFQDGQSFSGETSASLSDHSGLHFFQVLNQMRLSRIFIPWQVVKGYSIGPRLDTGTFPTTLQQSSDVQAHIRNQHVQRARQFNEYLKTKILYTSTEVAQALAQHPDYDPGHQKPFESKKIGEILVREQLITKDQLDTALAAQRDTPGKKLGEILAGMGNLDVQTLQLTLADKLGMPFVKLREFDVDVRTLNSLPVDIARKYRVMPLFVYRNHLVLAVDDPTDAEAFETVRFITGYNLELVMASRHEVEWAITRYYEVDDELHAAEELGINALDEFRNEADLKEAERLGKEKPIVRLVNNILLDAIRLNASDVHIRPMETRVDLLFRIDGALVKIRSFSKALLSAVASRIKIIGQMDVAERRLPQDGRARMSDRGALIDLRISAIPTVKGESIDIRLLNTQVGLRSLNQLGFNSQDREALEDLLHKSYGMLLVTGPTGSGKSTTLYAALQNIREQNVSIITVEEPVEYHIDGIEQIAVNSGIGYTFAKALRHILRHDPDVVMIGEIRDNETAQIAVESALTGHLVLSTLHTNSAAGAITRLLEMGLESYLLNSTLNGVLAQRLVRCNCPYCMQEEQLEPVVRQALNVGDDEVFYRGTGCEHCNRTGYYGRMAVYELLQVTPGIRSLLLKQPSTGEIHQQGVRDGMVPLTQHALSVARQRKTSLAEVYRIRLD